MGQGLQATGRPAFGDGYVIVPFDLVYPGNETLVGHRFDGAVGKKLDTMSETRL